MNCGQVLECTHSYKPTWHFVYNQYSYTFHNNLVSISGPTLSITTLSALAGICAWCPRVHSTQGRSARIPPVHNNVVLWLPWWQVFSSSYVNSACTRYVHSHWFRVHLASIRASVDALCGDGAGEISRYTYAQEVHTHRRFSMRENGQTIFVSSSFLLLLVRTRYLLTGINWNSALADVCNCMGPGVDPSPSFLQHLLKKLVEQVEKLFLWN